METPPEMCARFAFLTSCRAKRHREQLAVFTSPCDFGDFRGFVLAASHKMSFSDIFRVGRRTKSRKSPKSRGLPLGAAPVNGLDPPEREALALFRANNSKPVKDTILVTS